MESVGAERTNGPSSDTTMSRLRRRYAWLDHLARMFDRYVEYHGYHYAASITYFSVLSLVPVVMVALSVAAFVLEGQPAVLGRLLAQVSASVPTSIGPAIKSLIDNVINHRVKLGVFGLVVALYSGWNWMNALRDALTGMWAKKRPDLPLVSTVLKDLFALVVLGVALLISFALTATGGALGVYLLRLIGLEDTGWAGFALGTLSVLLALAANWLVFALVLAKLPREPVPLASAARAAVAAAIIFELLKYVGNLYFAALGRSPTGVTFGGIVGVLVFVYVVSRLLILTSAWTATAEEDPTPVPAACPVVITPNIHHHRTPSLPTVASLIGFGALSALLLNHLRARRK